MHLKTIIHKAFFSALISIASTCAMGQGYSVQSFSLDSNGVPIAISKSGDAVLLNYEVWYSGGFSFSNVGNFPSGNFEYVGISRSGGIFTGSGYVQVSPGTYAWRPFWAGLSPLTFLYNLPTPPGDSITTSSFCYGISGDGLTVLTGDQSGYDYSRAITFSSLVYPFTYVYPTLFYTTVPTIPQVCSENGSVVAATFSAGPGNGTYIWLGTTNTGQYILFGANGAYATAMSPDGSVVWGYYYDSSNNEFGYRWSAATGVQTIPNFIPSSATDDSFVAAGTSVPSQLLGVFGELYIEGKGVVNLNNFLQSHGLYIPAALPSAFISGDGTHIASLGDTRPDPSGEYITTSGFALTANNDSYTVPYNQLYSRTAAQGVLANDVNVYAGTAVRIAGPSHAASFTLNSDGSFQYQPVNGFSGADTFTYKVHRDLTSSNTATVTLNVQPPIPVIIDVQERLGLGPVPDGTLVNVYNNDGTALSPPQSTTTVGGVASFPPLPPPSGSNTSYEIVASVPSGGIGKPAKVNGAAGSSQTIYLTPVRPFVKQTLTTGSPVAFASTLVCGFKSTTGTDGQGSLIWLPDGTFNATFTMNPGVPAVVSATLGTSTSSNFKANGTYAQLCAKLTRTTLTAKTASGTTYIPKAGFWSISPGGLSESVNGQVTSGAWWLPNGTYTASLSGATMDGSSSIIIGPPTAQGWQTVVVSSGS